MTDVKVLASWDGWCSPCGQDRPLTLLEVGPRGLRAWLRGIGAEDRELTLACRVCGTSQHVPQHEEDDPDVPYVPLILSTAVAGRSIPVAQGRRETVVLPAPRTDPWPVPVSPASDAALLQLLADGLDVVTSRAS